MKKRTIKIAILGVGNCASSLVQGLEYYKNATQEKVIGLMHPVLGGYPISAITIVAAFDVNKEKVGKDVSQAIHAYPNNTKVFATVKKTGVIVQKTPVFDGIGEYLQDVIAISGETEIDPVVVLQQSGAEIL